MPNSVRAVLFDVVGTVLDPDPPVATAYASAGQRFGSRLKVDEIDRRFRDAFNRQEQEDQNSHAGRTDESRERRRWRAIVSDVFVDVVDAEGLFEDLWDHFAQSDNWRLFDDVPVTIDLLTSRGLVVGLASNFDARLHDILRGHEALMAFQHVFVSSELGHRKPSPSFFAGIQKALNLDADELMLVGDNVQNDYRAARAAGWRACLLDRRNTSSCENQVKSLADVACALEGG